MISREWLLNAIDECEVEPLTPTNREKLAQLYIIYNHLYSQSKPTHKGKPKVISVSGETEFFDLVNGKDMDSVLGIINELAETIQIIQPSLYYGFIKKLQEI